MPTIIKETGAVVAGANSFLTLAEADAYHADRGNASWASATEADRQASLIRAGQYVNGLPFKGTKTARDNPMAWPRLGVVDGDGFEAASDAVPARVAMAQAEAALRELSQGTLQPDLPGGGMVKRARVDAIETEYFGPGSTRFPAVESLLAGLVRPACATAMRRA